jgi:hypothetical protein
MKGYPIDIDNLDAIDIYGLGWNVNQHMPQASRWISAGVLWVVLW